MRAGKLRERVELQRLVRSQNTFGEDEQAVWALVKSMWADVEPLTSVERFRNGVERAYTPYTVRLRRDPNVQITTSDRIVWGGVIVDVESVIDVGGRHHTIEVVGNGTSGADIGTVLTIDGMLLYSPATPDYWQRSATVENPQASEDVSLFFTDRSVSVASINAIVRGANPSVTWTVRYGQDRQGAGTELVAGGTTTTNQNTGSDVSLFNEDTIPAGSFVWLETTSASGSVQELSITITGTWG